ncbi:RraA family protein [Lichenibacterium ramalinae]|uniref:Putative 4-hydroxy-4-methyl-2-oxoglutarate aldolase n=1 Tax=Lichenibacterium ramalinae TaxID=2316527 RepID=A0A4Q2R967_9HYPH|nr:RraA family protein [Lichenibacterium ramalinae]RYB02409.1 RraA family protein [Lichenibacterium ramalinae]
MTDTSSRPNPGVDLDAVASATYSAVFSDVCDAMGLRGQTVSPGLVPLGGPGTLIGWARTALSVPVEAAPARHYGGEIDFIDSLRIGDVAVVDCSRHPAAAWGELFSTAARGRGARGAVIDGLIRDRRKITEMGFLISGRGCRPTDSLGRVSIQEVDTSIQLGGVRVETGDLIVADEDGITVVPSAYAERAIALAMAKASTENKARDLLLAGGKLADVWERFRVL